MFVEATIQCYSMHGYLYLILHILSLPYSVYWVNVTLIMHNNNLEYLGLEHQTCLGTIQNLGKILKFVVMHPA